jgi:hypothetical protein
MNEVVGMARAFDGSFFIGAGFVLGSLGLAWAALSNPALPIIGSGRGALLAVGLIGLAGCTVGGLPHTTVVDWSHPMIVVGTALGIAALAIILAGLLGWDAVLRPVAQLVPGGLVRSPSTEQLAIIALAGVIALKWLISTAWTAVEVASPG